MSNNKTNNKQLKVLVITSTYPRHEADYAVPWMRETHRRLADEGTKLQFWRHHSKVSSHI